MYTNKCVTAQGVATLPGMSEFQVLLLCSLIVFFLILNINSTVFSKSSFSNKEYWTVVHLLYSTIQQILFLEIIPQRKISNKRRINPEITGIEVRRDKPLQIWTSLRNVYHWRRKSLQLTNEFLRDFTIHSIKRRWWL